MKVRNLLAAVAWVAYAGVVVFAMLLLSAQPALSQGTSLGWGQKPMPPQGSGTPQGQLKVGIVGGVDADSSAVPFQFDASGNVLMSNATPSANNYLYLPGVISCVFATVPEPYVESGIFTNRDSTAAIDCRGFNRAALLMFPSQTADADKGGSSGDSLMGMVFALQVRAHPTTLSDSLNTYRIPSGLYRQPIAAAQASAVNDTVGSMVEMIHYSESLVGTTAPRNRPAADERVVVVGNISKPNRGMVIWTDKIGGGGSALMPFTSWRLRALKSYTNVAGNAFAVPDSSVTGPPTLGGMRMRARVDLVLWRE